ncbi:high-affinity branched-chain amino acid transport ATP-binding protein LivF [mine drainage metagenome]|uniref:High-affinity branched-chain amino acid transport ATP-binding protein LivF n=1 Tax=mine drainage metagenome TaxID=410659 RepID=A0A1J5SJU3_9ZZZZ
MSELLLDMQSLIGGYGGNDILKGASLTVAHNEIVVIVGPNGAGKSTLMKSAFGLVKIRQGAVVFQGETITNMRPDLVVRRGMSFVPQEKNVFPSLTVQENLEMGAYLRKDGGAARQMERIFEIFPRLKERRKQAAGSMSGGERQMVAMGRALMLDPKLILLDEPTAGLSPLFIEQTFERIVEINKLGIGVLMVEQNAKQALEIAHRGYVLAMGRNRFEDTGAGLLANREIAEMFLGG